MKRKWTREDLIQVFEVLIEHESGITSRPELRNALSRDENLFVNQITRSATSNVAYRSVDFDTAKMSDEEAWKKIESSKYLDLLEDNAAAAIMSMAEKFGLLN